MKFILTTVLLLCLTIAVLTEMVPSTRPNYAMKPLDWTYILYGDGSLNVQVTTKGDLLAYIDSSELDHPALCIRRRNSEGDYEMVGNVTNVSGYAMTTNGKWFAVFGVNTTLFSVYADNVISEPSTVPCQNGFLLSDNTFVCAFQHDNKNFTIQSYEYNASDNDWTIIPGTDVNINHEIGFVGDYSTYKVYDSSMIITNATDPADIVVHIYNRESDLSWSLTDSVKVNNTFLSTGNVVYNGVDTLVYATPTVYEPSNADSYGLVFIYTKINGEWVEQYIAGSTIGYRPLAYIGLSSLFDGPDTLFITASYENWMGGPYMAGKVLMSVRNPETGLWDPAIDFSGSNGLFGWGVGTNDNDILVTSVLVYVSANHYAVQIYAAPKCLIRPIDVSCVDQDLDDCSKVDVAKESLFKFNNECSDYISASINGFTIINSQYFSAQMSFTRNYGSDYSCNATITCPAAPVSIGNVQQPQAPVAVQMPVAIQPPTPTQAPKSSANAIQIAAAAVLLVVLALLL